MICILKAIFYRGVVSFFFVFTLKIGEGLPIWLAHIFSDGLLQPPTRKPVNGDWTEFSKMSKLWFFDFNHFFDIRYPPLILVEWTTEAFGPFFRFFFWTFLKTAVSQYALWCISLKIHGTGIFTYIYVDFYDKCRQIYQSHGSYGFEGELTTDWTFRRAVVGVGESLICLFCTWNIHGGGRSHRR